MCELAWKLGWWAADVAKDRARLLEAGIEIEDLTPDIIRRAHELDRADWRKVAKWCENRNRAIEARIAAKEQRPEFGAQLPLGTVRRVFDAPQDKEWEDSAGNPTPATQLKLSIEPESTGSRVKLFGFPATAVIRWMGKQKFTLAQATRALNDLKANVAKGTIQAQLRAGEKGERGDPAALTAEQEKRLKQYQK